MANRRLNEVIVSRSVTAYLEKEKAEKISTTRGMKEGGRDRRTSRLRFRRADLRVLRLE